VDGLGPATTATSIWSGAINILLADWRNVTLSHLAMHSGHTKLTFVLFLNTSTLMMHYPSSKKKLLKSSPCSQTCWSSVITKYHLSSAGLQDWSHQIKAHCLVPSTENAVAEALQAQLKMIFDRLSMLMEQGRRIKNQIKEIYDLLADIMKHHGIHSQPHKSGVEEKKQSQIENSLNLALLTEGEEKSHASTIIQEKPTVNRLFLK